MGPWTLGKVEVRVVENRGRDVAPKLVAFRDVYDRYDLVLFLHSKRDSRDVTGAEWRDRMFGMLMGNQAVISSILAIFRCDPSIGMVSPQHLPVMRKWIHWVDTFSLSKPLAKRMGFRIQRHREIDFPSGSMFWARTRALAPLLALELRTEDFAEEAGQVGGTVAHALERLFFFAAEKAGYRWVKVATTDPHSGPTVQVTDCEGIRSFGRQRKSLLAEHGNPVQGVTQAPAPVPES